MKYLPKLKKVLIFIALALILGSAFAGIQLIQLSGEIREKFDGKRWSLPAVVYARALELYPGAQLSPDLFEKELELSGYRREDTVENPGGYRRLGQNFELFTRDFTFPSGREKAKHLIVEFFADTVQRITEKSGAEELQYVRLDPARIGSFHPLVHEDRIILKDTQIPELLKKSLIAVEDKRFPSHHGISAPGIVRAFLANVKAGRAVQGGSTLTQQLVKNFFLNRERTLSRKAQEAVMALLLEYHYSKDEILTAYINEVFLGQDGRRAIHGFGLASQYYFRRSIDDLSLAQLATLVGMVKGPSYYDPLRNPENCRQRRNSVLSIMAADGVIDAQQSALAQSQPLTDVVPQKHGFNRFPAFLELVKRQVTEQYREEDLKSSGVQILTTLDPQVQIKAENQLVGALKNFTQNSNRPDTDGAVIVTGRENGEVQAVVGGKETLRSGFNRALDARRSIGSLIKPVVYLAALQQGYTLATPLEDIAIELENEGKSWKPSNYDNSQHGRVPFYAALVKSYNLATVRLGMAVGLDNVVRTLNDLGYSFSPQKVYPSILLGSLSMTPIEVSQIYQTIASGGFHLPLRAIQSVLDSDGRLLTRYGLEVEQRFSPEAMYLLNHALQRIMKEGTGKGLWLSEKLTLAGKTGTTNDLRDSWFAGYSKDKLVTVWLGNDDNKTISLSGSTGALVVWGGIMEAVGARSLQIPEPGGIVWRRIDLETLRPAGIFNRNYTSLPFIAEEGALHRIEDRARNIIDAFGEIIK